jgi:hypothetical protein
MSDSALLIATVGALIGAAVGGGVAAAGTWFLVRYEGNRSRERKAAGYFRGIDAELDYAIKHAKTYVEGDLRPDGKRERKLSPAYRLLTRFTGDGTAWLTGEGFISKAEIEALLAHLAAAEEFNRCLDEVAQDADSTRARLTAEGVDRAELERETRDRLSRSASVSRATVKAENLSKGDPPAGVAVKARDAIRAAAERARLKLAE